MVLSRPAVQLIAGRCRCPGPDTPDDMWLGACGESLGISIVHFPGFHQVCIHLSRTPLFFSDFIKIPCVFDPGQTGWLPAGITADSICRLISQALDDRSAASLRKMVRRRGRLVDQITCRWRQSGVFSDGSITELPREATACRTLSNRKEFWFGENTWRIVTYLFGSLRLLLISCNSLFASIASSIFPVVHPSTLCVFYSPIAKTKPKKIWWDFNQKKLNALNANWVCFFLFFSGKNNIQICLVASCEKYWNSGCNCSYTETGWCEFTFWLVGWHLGYPLASRGISLHLSFQHAESCCFWLGSLCPCFLYLCLVRMSFNSERTWKGTLKHSDLFLYGTCIRQRYTTTALVGRKLYLKLRISRDAGSYS